MLKLSTIPPNTVNATVLAELFAAGITAITAYQTPRSAEEEADCLYVGVLCFEGNRTFTFVRHDDAWQVRAHGVADAEAYAAEPDLTRVARQHSKLLQDNPQLQMWYIQSVEKLNKFLHRYKSKWKTVELNDWVSGLCQKRLLTGRVAAILR